MEPIATYQGEGRLTLTDELKAGCTFECTQLTDAQILCWCHIDTFESSDHHDKLLNAFSNLAESPCLEGEVTEGDVLFYFDAHDLFLVSAELKTGEAFSLTFIARNMRLLEPDLTQEAGVLRFGLVNFEFDGTEHCEEAHAAMQLPLTLAGHQVSIRPLPDYSTRKKTLWAEKGIAVTCEAVVEIDSASKYAEIEAIIGDLGVLLSLARGCRVQWVYRHFFAPNGTAVERYHRNTPTRPYSALPLIPVQPPKDTRDFITQTFDALRAQESAWELQKAILTYVEAKQSDDYLVMRGLKLVVLAEFLKGCYLRHKAETQPEETDLLKTLRQALNIENEASFKDALRMICSALRLPVSEPNLKRFAANRDVLVQRAQFQKAGDPWQDYTFMLNMIGEILLAILGYEGHYNDWTQSFDTMRTRFTLEAPDETA